MFVISNIANDKFEAERYLRPDNLLPLYDQQELNVALEEGLDPKPYIPMMPLLENGFGRGTHIPVYDNENSFNQRMGLLVSRSLLEQNLFVVRHIPVPAETQYPTRIGTGRGGKIIYPPIVGFVAQGVAKRFSRNEIALILREGSDEHIVELGRAESAQIVASLVLGACSGAVRRHNAHSSDVLTKYQQSA